MTLSIDSDSANIVHANVVAQDQRLDAMICWLLEKLVAERFLSKEEARAPKVHAYWCCCIFYLKPAHVPLIIQLHLTLIRTRGAYADKEDDFSGKSDMDNRRRQAPLSHHGDPTPPSFDARPLFATPALCDFDFGSVRLQGVHVCRRLQASRSGVYESLAGVDLP